MAGRGHSPQPGEVEALCHCHPCPGCNAPNGEAGGGLGSRPPGSTCYKIRVNCAQVPSDSFQPMGVLASNLSPGMLTAGFEAGMCPLFPGTASPRAQGLVLGILTAALGSELNILTLILQPSRQHCPQTLLRPRIDTDKAQMKLLKIRRC